MRERAFVWFRKAEDTTLLGAGFGVSHAAADGWAFVILDGRLFDSDRSAETTTIDRWYSGIHHDFGAIIIPNGLPAWTSDAMPGHLHDLTCARELGVAAALNRAAAELDLPALVDAGHDGAGHGIKTPLERPPTAHLSQCPTPP